MDYGISIFATDTTLQPIELAKAVEERAFESLWLPEHSHIPSARTTPWGGRQGAPPLPEKYWRTHDTFVALAAAAAVTERLKLATGITLVAQRDPIWLAKEVASLDVISNGRVLLGVGYGWNREEMAHHGVEYGERRQLLAEKVTLMKALWTQDEASFEGEMLTLKPSWAWPKPVQKPHPPIVMGGGAGPNTIAHMVEFCDGWIPLGRYEVNEHTVGEVRAAIANAGRDPDQFELTYFGAKPTDEALDRLEGLGFQRAVFGVESASPDEVMAKLDELAQVAERRRAR